MEGFCVRCCEEKELIPFDLSNKPLMGNTKPTLCQQCWEKEVMDICYKHYHSGTTYHNGYGWHGSTIRRGKEVANPEGWMA